MGLTVTLAFHQVEDVVFDDINDLNDDLLKNTGFGELYDDVSAGDQAYQNTYNGKSDTFQGPFQFNAAGDLEIACISDGSCFEEYGKYSQVWSLFHNAEAQVIANHMTGGKLVFLQEVEGNDNEFWILTPGKVAHKYESEVKF